MHFITSHQGLSSCVGFPHMQDRISNTSGCCVPKLETLIALHWQRNKSSHFQPVATCFNLLCFCTCEADGSVCQTLLAVNHRQAIIPRGDSLVTFHSQNSSGDLCRLPHPLCCSAYIQGSLGIPARQCMYITLINRFVSSPQSLLQFS